MKRILLIAGVIFLGLGFLVSTGLLILVVSSGGRAFSSTNTSLNYATTQDELAGSAGLPAAPAPAALKDSYSGGSSNGTRGLDAAVSNNAAAADRLVIKNADVTLIVKDPVAKMQAIINTATGLGGYVVNSNMSENFGPDGTKVPQGSLLVRVPAAKLDEALKQIESDVVEVQNENRSGQDVTKEYTDLQSQLDNLNATEQQLTLIMQKADKTEDVLAVFSQLSQIRGQIDVIKGQMKYYQDSAAMSAVTVTLIAQQSTQPISVAGWEPQGQARDAIQALVNFSQNFVNFLIWLVLLVIPALIIILLPAFLIFLLVRAILRRRQAKKVVSSE